MLPNPACTRRGYRRSKSAVDMRLKLVLWQRIFHETRRAGEANRWAADQHIEAWEREIA
jgi:hypothetical protein